MSELLDLVMSEHDDKMKRAVEHTKAEFSNVRTGRASSSIIEKLPVEYYGSQVPLQQLASFSVPEARLLVVNPFDANSMGAIEKAIRNSDLGLNPSNDGKLIRLVFPQLTEERRKELIKVARHKAEEGRVSIRNVRRHAKDSLDKLVKDGEVGEDDVARAEKELEKLTHTYVEHVDEALRSKEAELLEV